MAMATTSTASFCHSFNRLRKFMSASSLSVHASDRCWFALLICHDASGSGVVSATLFTETTSCLRSLRRGATGEVGDVHADQPVDIEQHDHAVGYRHEAPDVVGRATR